MGPNFNIKFSSPKPPKSEFLDQFRPKRFIVGTFTYELSLVIIAVLWKLWSKTKESKYRKRARLKSRNLA